MSERGGAALPNALTLCKCSQFSPHILTPANLPRIEQEILAHPYPVTALTKTFNTHYGHYLLLILQ